jgi:hypothetical protein
MKNKWVSLLLCLFLGWLGAHRFYERKIPSGILYLCTLGLLGIGVLFDLWLLLIKPNEPITESYQYNTYLKAVEALQKSGYEVDEFERQWCIIRATVKRNSANCGHIFVVADPKPGFVSYMIGAIFPKYQEFHDDNTEYGYWKKNLEMLESRFERNSCNFNSYHYWPDGNLIAGVAGYSDGPTADNKWLNILKSVIG